MPICVYIWYIYSLGYVKRKKKEKEERSLIPDGYRIPVLITF